MARSSQLTSPDNDAYPELYSAYMVLTAHRMCNLESGDAMDDPTTNDRLTWFDVGNVDVVGANEVTVVRAGHHAIALSRTDEGWGAVTNRCPHQGGPLGEGMIEGCWLICPWHGWEYDPKTGETPGPFDDKVQSYSVEVRDDRVFVGVLEPETQRPMPHRHFARTDETLKTFCTARRIVFTKFRGELDAVADQDPSPRG
jgi:nitrite reductase/ring-hydroxylating ferredoxin subunit